MEKTVVLLMGAQGSGKSTYCREFLPDHYRISQDEMGRTGHVRLYEDALARGEPRIVIDRTNAQRTQRKRFLDLARQHGYRTRIVWLNADRAQCLARCQARNDHPTLRPEESERALAIYYRSLRAPSRREADSVEIVGMRPNFVPVVDLTETIGRCRHVIVGDVHGCLDELRDLLGLLRFDQSSDVLIAVGDIVDRGPKIRETVEFLLGLPRFHMVLGNHEHKLLRYLLGRPVKVGGGMQSTIDAYGGSFPPDFADRLAALPLILKTPSGYVVHAGFDPEMLPEEQQEDDCLYMRYYGGKTYFDALNGRIWYGLWPKEAARVFFGHIPDPEGPIEGNVVALDAGCVFGEQLRAFDSNDGRVHAVPARRAYVLHHNKVVSGGAAPLDAIRQREEYVANGLLRSDQSDDGRLVIYTYTDACTYAGAWDSITRYSRGHIYDRESGECVAFPFPKFFNLGENAESLPEKFAWEHTVEVYEKLDGWLGVLYRHDGRFKVATRGSFHSSGATWATRTIQNHDFSCLTEEVTLCFELIHPQHRIILDYSGQETLVILAAFNRHTGEEFPREALVEWARWIGLPLVPEVGPLTLDQLLDDKKQSQQKEGFVLRFIDGRRVKVKTDWYSEIARILSNLTPIAVWQTMRSGKVPLGYLQRLPEELRGLAESHKAELEGQYAAVDAHLRAWAEPLLARFGNDRKALAIHVHQHAESIGWRRPAIFLLLDGKQKPLEQFIHQRIYPHANRLVDLEGLLRDGGGS